MAERIMGSLVEMLKRDKQHMSDIFALIESLQRRFGDERIQFAVIGAMALKHYGYDRFTEDVDILTTRKGLEKIHSKFVGRGLVPRAAGMRKMLRDTDLKVNLDIITAGEHAGSEESPIKYPNPHSGSFVKTGGGIWFPRIEKLVEFKLASGIWGKRLKDHSDVIELIRFNRLDESFAQKLDRNVRSKFLELLQLFREEKQIE